MFLDRTIASIDMFSFWGLGDSVVVSCSCCELTLFSLSLFILKVDKVFEINCNINSSYYKLQAIQVMTSLFHINILLEQYLDCKIKTEVYYEFAD